jgi:uncharacterized protein
MGQLADIAAMLRTSPAIAAKADIAFAARHLGLAGAAIRVGDDCAAIPDHDGYTLFAIEGFINRFIAADPWFAGWCGVMVNVSDLAAMGGRPTAVVDAVWCADTTQAEQLLGGMRAACDAFAVPLVGGHTNLRNDRPQLAVAILGRAKALLTSFDSRPGDRLIAAIDLRGRYRDPFPNWDAATAAPPDRLRGDLAVLPALAEAGLCKAAKDISQAGVIGTAMMLADCSATGVRIDLASIPRPDGVALDRWLMTFPSFGYLLSVPPYHVDDVLARFAARDIAAAAIGTATACRLATIGLDGAEETIWNFTEHALLECTDA